MKKVALLIVLSLIALAIVPSNFAGNKTIKGINPIRATEVQTGSSITNLGLYGGWPREIAIDPTNPNNVYIITASPNGLFWTNNGGSSWKGLPSTSDYGQGVDVTVNSANGDVYAAIGNNLLKSTDDGTSWTEISPSGSTWASGFLTYSGSTLFVAGTDGKIRASSNGGATFSSGVTVTSSSETFWSIDADQNGILYAVSSLTDSPTSGIKLWKSLDSGASWGEVSISGVSGISKVEVNPSNPSHLVLGGAGSAFQSTNSGSSWSAISGASGSTLTFDSNGRLYIGSYYLDSPYTGALTSFASRNTSSGNSLGGFALVVNPSSPNTIYSDTTGGMAKSTNGGASWTDINNGIVAVTVKDMSQATAKNNTWVATFNGLARSSNFLSATPDWTFPIMPLGDSGMDSVWVKPDNADIVVASGRGKIYKTTNATAATPTWSQSTTSSLPSTNDVYQIVSDPTNSSTLYAAYALADQSSAKTGGVLKSTDAGSTWSDMSLPDSAPAQSITIAKDGALFVGVGSPAHYTIAIRGIYKYSGGAWSKLSGAPNYEVPAILADPENANIIYAGAGDTNSNKGYFYRSTDGGTTWSKINDANFSSLKDPASIAVERTSGSNTLYFGASNGSNGAIYKSGDGGSTWGVLYKGLESEAFNALLFDGLVAGNNRGLYGLKSKASVGLKAIPKKAKKGKVVKLKITLKDAATKKKLKKRTVLLYKKVIVKKKVKKKWKKVAKWKLIKKAKLNKKGEAVVKTKLSVTTVYLVKWKPGKSDKEEYTTSKSKSLKVKVKK